MSTDRYQVRVLAAVPGSPCPRAKILRMKKGKDGRHIVMGDLIGWVGEASWKEDNFALAIGRLIVRDSSNLQGWLSS